MWLTGALRKLANGLLAFSIRSLLALLQQRVSQSDLGGVLLSRRLIGRQGWDESEAAELLPAALRIGGYQTASKITYIYRHLLLRRVRTRFNPTALTECKVCLHSKGIEDTLRWATNELLIALKSPLVNFVVCVHRMAKHWTQLWSQSKGITMYLKQSTKKPLYLSSQAIHSHHWGHQGHVLCIVAGNMGLLITL